MLGTATMSFTTWRFGDILLSDLLFLMAAAAIVVKMLTGNDRDLATPEQRRARPSSSSARSSCSPRARCRASGPGIRSTR